MNTDKYYASMDHLMRVFDKTSRKLGFMAKTAAEFEQWKTTLRRKLREITGMDTMEACDPQPQLLQSEIMDGYRREKWVIQTEPGVWMPFYVLIPNGIQSGNGKKTPCIIAAHGHGSAGKFSVSGRDDIPAVEKQIQTYNYDYGVKFVREGYIVFCPDARAFGERREWMHQKDDEESFLHSSCFELNHMAIPLGQSVTGMWTWDLMRLIDYIESRDDCGEIGCVGLSGGGLQSLWLAAMDDRIRSAVVSGYFYGYKDSLLRDSYHCACNYVPNLWKNVDIGDLGALIAPRALLIETGSRDPLNGKRGLVNVTEQVEISLQAYRVLGAEERLIHHVFEGGHAWNGERTSDFVNEHLIV